MNLSTHKFPTSICVAFIFVGNVVSIVPLEILGLFFFERLRLNLSNARDLVEFVRGFAPFRIRVASNPEIVVGPTPLGWRPPERLLKSIFNCKPAVLRRSLLFFITISNTHSRSLSLKLRRVLKHNTNIFNPFLQTDSLQHTVKKVDALCLPAYPEKSNFTFSLRINLESLGCSFGVAPSISSS